MHRLIGVAKYGLGDRTALIANIVSAARALNMKPCIHWLYNNEFNCNYHKLFKNNDFEFVDSTLRLELLRQVGQHLSSEVVFEEDIVVYTNNFIWIDGILVDYFDRLRNFEVQDDVLAMVPELPPNTVAVHLRRGDILTRYRNNLWRIVYTDTMIDAVKKEMDEGRAQNVLLCTDGTQAEYHAFKRAFGERLVYFPPASLDRNSESGCVGALIDFIMMSRCNFIMGGRSMLTLMASVWGDTELKVFRENEPYDPQRLLKGWTANV